MLLDHTVFSAAVKNSVKKIVSASSACVYPTSLQDSYENLNYLKEQDAGFHEQGKAFADGKYGWAKLMGECQLQAFNKQYGVDGIACRIFTAYGERENISHAVIALIVKVLKKMEPFEIWGSGNQTRNFTHVEDTVSGLVLSGAKLSGFEVINVGTDEHHSVFSLCEHIFDIVGWRPKSIKTSPEKFEGVKNRSADCSKCKELLGWSPKVGLSEGLSRTIDWVNAEFDLAGCGLNDKDLSERFHYKKPVLSTTTGEMTT